MSLKEAVRSIATYSADTFGVCSALFELGGMVVIHDPSGCNSTYTTHDEPRWYDRDSLIFISGLTEMDAIMGNDDKLVDDVVTGAKDFSPKFIVLLCTPVPLMMGTDFPALAKIITDETGIPTYAASTNSMETYDLGVSWAMELLAKHMVRERAPKSMCCSWNPTFASCSSDGTTSGISVNVLGLTPLDFSINGSDKSIKSFLEGNGFDVISMWAMGSNLAQIARAGTADVNLVVSFGGLAAAQELERRFGTPYVVGVPIGRSLQGGIAMDIRMAAGMKQNRYTCAKRIGPDRLDITIIGESVYSTSLAAALSHEYGYGVRVLCPLHSTDNILTEWDRFVESEAEIAKALGDSPIIIADPLYKPVCPANARFIPLGHEGFSGRLYEKSIPNLIDNFDAFAALVQGDDSHGHE